MGVFRDDEVRCACCWASNGGLPHAPAITTWPVGQHDAGSGAKREWPTGNVATEIVDCAEDFGADFAGMSTHPVAGPTSKCILDASALA